jgi:hypothetical protein
MAVQVGLTVITRNRAAFLRAVLNPQAAQAWSGDAA